MLQIFWEENDLEKRSKQKGATEGNRGAVVNFDLSSAAVRAQLTVMVQLHSSDLTAVFHHHFYM